MTVLVLTDEFDLTADDVVTRLMERGVEVFRCDTGWFPSRLTIAAELTSTGWSGELRTADRSVRLEGIHSIWYRRPTYFDVPDNLTEAERRHAESEARLGLGGVLAALPVLWVNHPAHESDAAYKPKQLAVAAASGLSVPGTLIANDRDAVRMFASRFGSRLAHKLLGGAAFVQDGTPVVAYTSQLNATHLVDLRGVEVTAHLFQEWVEKLFEVRVTVVGDRVFAAAIHADSPNARIDWRSDYEALAYEVVTVPDDVNSGIRRFLDHFGLVFGAFDFIVTPDHEWIFLECNSSGQYGWIEAHTGLPISAAVADLLSSGPAGPPSP